MKNRILLVAFSLAVFAISASDLMAVNYVCCKNNKNNELGVSPNQCILDWSEVGPAELSGNSWGCWKYQ